MCFLAVFTGFELRDEAEFAKPFHQAGETLAIFLEHGSKFHPESATWLYMADNRFSADLSFFHEKMKFGDRTDRLGLPRQKKHAAGAKILNLRSIVQSISAPAHMDIRWRMNTRAKPS
jgi:hypothetical protein